MDAFMYAQKQQRDMRRVIISLIIAVGAMVGTAALLVLAFVSDKYSETNNGNNDANLPEIAANFEAYTAQPKGLYVDSMSATYVNNSVSWKALLRNHNFAFDRLVEYCLKNGVTEVSLYGGTIADEIEEFSKGRLPLQDHLNQCLAKLNDKKIAVNLVYSLSQTANDLKNYELVPIVARLVKNLNETYRIKSLVWNQGPNEQLQYQKFVFMLMDSAKICHTSVVVRQLWLSEQLSLIALKSGEIQSFLVKNPEIVTFADLLVYVTNSSQFQAFASDWKTIQAVANKYQSSTKKFRRPTNIIIQTGVADSSGSLQKEIVKNYEQFYADFVALSKYYDQVTINDYRQFYANFYCVEPVDWVVLGSRVNCSATRIPNGQAPEIKYNATIPGIPDTPTPPEYNDKLNETFATFVGKPKGLFAYQHSAFPVDNLVQWVRLIKDYNYAFGRLTEYVDYNKYTEVFLYGGSIQNESSDFAGGGLPYDSNYIEDITNLTNCHAAVNIVVRLSLEPDQFEHAKQATLLAKAVKNANSTTSPIKSIILDQQTTNPANYDTFIEVLQEMNKIYPTRTFILQDYLQQELSYLTLKTEYNKQFRTFSDLLLSLTNNSIFQAFAEDFNAVDILIQKMQFSANRVNNQLQDESGHKFTFQTVIQVGDTAFDNKTPNLSKLLQADQSLFYANVSKLIDKYGDILIYDYRNIYMDLTDYEPVKWVGTLHERQTDLDIIPDTVQPNKQCAIKPKG